MGRGGFSSSAQEEERPKAAAHGRRRTMVFSLHPMSARGCARRLRWPLGCDQDGCAVRSHSGRARRRLRGRHREGDRHRLRKLLLLQALRELGVLARVHMEAELAPIIPYIHNSYRYIVS